MREVDRRSKYDRRVFLKGAATAVPTVAIATSAGLTVSDAWADDATTLTPTTLKTLARFFFVADPDGYKIEVIQRGGRFG